MGALLDSALERAFSNRNEPIRFIQIGGNDGVYQDPLHNHRALGTYEFEWGHIYEPIPEYFSKLVENTRSFPFITCHQLAVDTVAVPGTRNLNYVSPSDIEKHRLPQSSQGIGSFFRDRNAIGGVGYSEAKYNAIKEYIRTVEVDTIPASEVVKRHSAANLLVTDCEGYDVELIADIFNHDTFRPVVVQFEHLGPMRDLLNETLVRLADMNYKVSRAGKDIVCEFSRA